MTISIIAAVAKNRGIGFNGRIPWHLSSDFKRFKELTTGHSVIMGQNTYLSLGRPLPNRRNIVLSLNSGFSAPGCEVVNSLDSVLTLTKVESEVFIIGGGQIYASTLPLADKLYLTWVNAEPQADVFFPKLNLADWTIVSSADFPANENNDYSSTFVIYKRRSSS